MKKRLLLISNSTNYGEDYLEWPMPYITDFLSQTGVKRALFIPYAGVALSEEGVEASFDTYEARVNEVLSPHGFEVYSIHREKDPVQAVKDALAIMVGGGNTFHLVYMMHKLKLMKAVHDAVQEGLPYVGWSAGANLACPTLRTTNDMPIIEPEHFDCLDLVPFQINPHFIDAALEGHGGETREQRIEEFTVVNPGITVVGLREGTLLEVCDDKIELKGSKPLRVFKYGESSHDYEPDSDLSFLL
ncbi:MAG: dipeptidase PepE [Bacteroidales bacterium]